MKNNNKIIIWDWNGTIVDDALIFVEIMNDFLKGFGLKNITLKDYRKHFCFPVHDYYTSLGISLSEEEFRLLSIRFINKYKEKMFVPKLKKNILTVIRHLYDNGFIQIVVSAQEKKLLNRSVAFYGLKKYFDGIYGLDNNFAISKLALAKNKLAPWLDSGPSLLVIGDTLHDLEMARYIESSCCLVSWGHNSLSRLKKSKETVFNCPSTLLAFIKQL
tara:strand:- start:31599 stop:32249 length:651 start_codon:yes stop_codon:yes gene_type:complete